MISPSIFDEARMALYRDQGYAIGGPLLAGDALQTLRGRMDARIAALRPGQRSENLASLHYDDGYFLDLFLSDPFLDVAEYILGPDIALFTSYAISKRPNDGLPVAWHQDAAFFPISPMATFTLWLAVDDATPDNGCMQVIPGSHRARTIYPHNTDRTGDSTLALGLADAAEGWPIDVPVAAGCFSVHDPFLLHGSPPNRSDRRRCGITIKYVPTSVELDRSFVSATGFDWNNVRLYHGRGRRGRLACVN